MNQSVWLQSRKREAFSSDKLTVDVVVIGAGLAGLATAWCLKNEGREVLLLEAGTIGSGTSGYTTGKITSQHHLIYDYLIEEFGDEKAQMYADANRWALHEYREIIKEQEISCHFEVQNGSVFCPEDDSELEKEYQAALKLGMDCRIDRGPFPGYRALTFLEQAQFNPVEYLTGLADRLVSSGGAVIENCRVTDVEENATGCTVISDDGRVFHSDYVVFSTLFPLLDHSYHSMRPMTVHATVHVLIKQERCFGGQRLSRFRLTPKNLSKEQTAQNRFEHTYRSVDQKLVSQ